MSEALRHASTVCSVQNIQLVLAYTPVVNLLEENGEIKIVRNEDAAKASLFKELCDANGIIWVDTFPEFKSIFQRERLLPFGFANTRPAAGHLNQLGHRILSEKLVKSITS